MTISTRANIKEYTRVSWRASYVKWENGNDSLCKKCDALSFLQYRGVSQNRATDSLQNVANSTWFSSETHPSAEWVTWLRVIPKINSNRTHSNHVLPNLSYWIFESSHHPLPVTTRKWKHVSFLSNHIKSQLYRSGNKVQIRKLGATNRI